MKKLLKALSILVALAIMTVCVIIPTTASAASYSAPDGAIFIADTVLGRAMINIAPGTTVGDLSSTFSGYTLSVADPDGAVIGTDLKLATGCMATVKSGSETVDSFVIIIYGDINKDGIIDASDSLALAHSILGYTTLDRAQTLAADISLNRKSDASDALRLSMHMLGIATIDQSAAGVEKNAGKKVRIVTIGDSITEGTGTFNSYRTQLACDLYAAGANVEFVGPRSSPDPRVSSKYNKHAGWAGYFVGPTSTASGRSDGIYQQLPSIFPYDSDGNVQDIADIGLMMIGHNNYFRNIALVDSDGNQIFETEYKNLVRAIFERQPNLTLYCATMINQANGHSPDYNYQDGGVQNKHYGFTYDQAQNANLEQWVADLVAEGYDVRFFDLCTATNLSGDKGDFDADDGTHPNEQGQAKMGDAWFNRIIDDVLEINNSAPAESNEIKVESMSLSETQLNLYTNFSATLSYSISPVDADFTSVIWTSSNKSVATVDSFGTVKGISKGVAKITATSLSGKMSATCTVTVTEDPTITQMPTNVFSSTFSTADKALFTKSSNTNFFKGDIYMDGNACYLESAEKYLLGNSWEAALIAQSTINFTENWEQYFISMSVGDLELRIIDCNKKYELKYNGSVIATATSNYDIDKCRFTLRYNKGHVQVIKENLTLNIKTIILEAEVENRSYYAPFKLYNYELWRACLMTGCSMNTIK